MNAAELFQAGDLHSAVEAALADVKKHPADTSKRGLLAQLLCFAGDLERADRQLDTISQQNVEAAIAVSMLRQLIRAETSRREFFEQGRPPESISDPSEWMRAALRASVEIRNQQFLDAKKILDDAAEHRPPFRGTWNEQPIDDLMDMDDLLAGVLEVLTCNGKYYWIPWQHIESVTCDAPKQPWDLLWRRARVVIAGGPDGDVYLPVLYAGTHQTDDQQLMLGRGTTWSEDETHPIRGFGQRMWLAGDDAVSIMELKSLHQEQPVPVTGETGDLQ